MESILKSIKKRKIPVNPAVVISNEPDARGIKIAKKLGVTVEVLESKNFKGNRTEYDKALMSILTRYGVTPRNGLVCLAGFMRIISPEFIKRYKNRIVNIHPSLLPSFPGLHAQRQALQHGVKYSGCTVHFVDEETDTGPIIMQSVVKVNQDDTEESLSTRILRKEHLIYPKVVDLFARKKIKVYKKRTIVSQE